MKTEIRPGVQRVEGEASRAFLRMQLEGAREFKSLGALRQELSNLSSQQEDVRTDSWTKAPKVVPLGDEGQWELRVPVGDRDLRFNEHAFGQFANRIGFPAKTLSMCNADLARRNVAHFNVVSGEQKVLIRTEGDHVRAWLSGGYKTVSHAEVVDTLLRSDLPYEVNYAALTPRRMFTLLIEDTQKFEGPDGSVMSHGTYVGNSETGEGPYFACDFFYDYICQNRNIWGFKVKGGRFSKKHVGDVREGLKTLAEWIGSDRKAAIGRAKDAFLAAHEDRWGDDEEKVLTYLSDRGITQAIARQAIAVSQERWPDGEFSRFRIYSGLTKVAQQFAPDKRFEVEELAGALL